MKTPETYEEFLAWMQGRYRVNECGCWVWRMCLNGHDLPVASINEKSFSVRRRLVELKRGVSLGKLMVTGGAQCDTGICVNPEHVRVMSRGKFTSMVRQPTSHVKRHNAKLLEIRRDRSPIGWDDVREFRRLAAEGHAPTAIQRITGTKVSRQAIRLVINHITWKEAANGASVFAWRPAA